MDNTQLINAACTCKTLSYLLIWLTTIIPSDCDMQSGGENLPIVTLVAIATLDDTSLKTTRRQSIN